MLARCMIQVSSVRSANSAASVVMDMLAAKGVTDATPKAKRHFRTGARRWTGWRNY
jgi:hypothetical protein